MLASDLEGHLPLRGSDSPSSRLAVRKTGATPYARGGLGRRGASPMSPAASDLVRGWAGLGGRKECCLGVGRGSLFPHSAWWRSVGELSLIPFPSILSSDSRRVQSLST